MKRPIVLGITGASGAIYAVRLLEVLRAAGRDVHLSISPSGRDVIHQELNIDIDLDHFDKASLGSRSVTKDPSTLTRSVSEPHSTVTRSVSAAPNKNEGAIHYYHHQDFMAPAASGSHLTDGMVICPCSGTTLSGVATGLANNLILRAAEVHLKERRKLIVVPRETPLSLAHIDNMRRVTEVGAVVLPASPGFYHGAKSVNDLVDFVVARICDQLGVEHSLTKRWGTK